MSLILHVFETWSLIFREEHKSEMPEKKKKYRGTHPNLKGAKQEGGGGVDKFSK